MKNFKTTLRKLLIEDIWRKLSREPDKFAKAKTIAYEVYKDEIDVLPIVDEKKAYGKKMKPTDNPTWEEFKSPAKMPQMFILTTAKMGRFVVNTEGAPYARYIARIKE